MCRRRIATRILPALGALALLIVVAMQPDLLGRWSGWVAVAAPAVQYGTFFGLIALAAGWTVFSFARPKARIFHSLVLVAMSVLAMCLGGLLGNVARGELLAFAGVIGLVAIAQWLMIAGLLWPLLATRNVRLCNVQDLTSVERAKSQQYGIREMLIATAVAAVLLGAIRWFLSQPWPSSLDSSASRTLLVFGYLAACNTFVMLPLLVSPLLRRFAMVSTLLALAFVAVVSVCELTALRQQFGPVHAAHAINLGVVCWLMNFTQAGWVLAALITFRADGYRLVAAIAVNKADQW